MPSIPIWVWRKKVLNSASPTLILNEVFIEMFGDTIVLFEMHLLINIILFAIELFVAPSMQLTYLYVLAVPSEGGCCLHLDR
jgi:hypothetical protein